MLSKRSVFFHPDVLFGEPFFTKYQTPAVNCSGIKRGDKCYVCGYEMVYIGDNIPEDIEKFYENRLLNKGWTLDESLNADGPFGHAWGFKKEKYRIIFVHRVITKRINPWAGPFKQKISIIVNDKKLLNL